MLLIFDVDGTLVGGEGTDWDCFSKAMSFATGQVQQPEFWAGLKEVTAKAIVHEATKALPIELRNEIETVARAKFLAELVDAHSRDRFLFGPKPGALAVIEYLRARDDVKVAIATGDWLETIQFKLKSAGIPIENYPIATSSDRLRRCEIIGLAAERANVSLADSVYIGDGPWDLKACQELGMAFLGVGSRKVALKAAGARHVIDSLELHEFVPWLEDFRSTFEKS